MAQDKNVKNPHANHRSRMREKLFENGAEIFHDHELLEMFLFACESRRNTNDIAHALIDRFGSLHGVLTATPDALKSVKGIGDSASSHILVVREMMRRIGEEKLDKAASFDSYEELGKYFVGLYSMAAVEELYVMTLDNGMRMISCTRVCSGTVNSTPACICGIVKEVLNKEAPNVVIAHNHPGGKLIASPEDAVMTRIISSNLKSMGINLVDHILVAEGKYTSILHAGFGI